MQAPCKDCSERTLGCHSVCEKYIAYTEYRKEISAKRQQYRQDNDEFFSVRWKKK